MEKSHAYRNLDLCSKDCLCLFVCPTGATDTETGQIDFEKCIGCGACQKACPAHAITMVPNQMPKQQDKDPQTVKELFAIANNKISEIRILNNLLTNSSENEKKLIKALIHSNKVIIEDIMREAGYMLPQSKNTHEFLIELKNKEKSLAKTVDQILEKIKVNE